MSDVLGAMIDLTKLNDSFRWLVQWAKDRWKKRGTEVAYKIGENEFQSYTEKTFSDCPYFDLGFYALIVLRPDIARRRDKKILICICKLAEIET